MCEEVSSECKVQEGEENVSTERTAKQIVDDLEDSLLEDWPEETNSQPDPAHRDGHGDILDTLPKVLTPPS